ncbi:tetratricopeptide repeat protein [Thiorhodococcus minor]|uniref:Tetratricopeptide repeat protein n=1 Tax=Thiorhodococcus minor TaxID=57489 RepID=A0A6M0K2W8_9GAMM|nr:tetratricopeptide repeat protein [Thiorhodococcus minor]NEV62665.1 tetratricopeptide repeat protein [Thiorhodococcus minor]
MSKKTKKPKTSTTKGPESAQLRAIDRLMESAKLAQAEAKLKPLVKQFPKHGGLQQRRIEVSERLRGPAAAALSAYHWAEAQPNSLGAQETLFSYALKQGHLVLADSVARQIVALGGAVKGFPLPADVRAKLLELPDGTETTAEQMARFDLGKLLLEGGDFESAIDWLEGVDLLPARNNLALALHHSGQTEAALGAFLRNWEEDGDNLFALGWAVRLRLYRGDEEGALGLCRPLVGAEKPRRIDDALSQLNGLLLLRQDADAWEAFCRVRDADWLDGSGHSDALLLHFGACAASRLGRTRDAKPLWQEALQIHPDLSIAEANLRTLERDSGALAFPMVFDIGASLPLSAASQLREHPEQALAELGAASLYLNAIYLSGDDSLRQLAGLILRHRAKQGDHEAVSTLKGFAGLAIGVPEDRFAILRYLREEGLLAAGEPVQFWDGSRLREIKMISTQVTREPEESDLPDPLQERLEDSIEHFNAGRNAAAEALLHEILEQAPDHRIVMGNLAALRMRQGRADEAQSLLEQVVAKHPDYLIARCNLASLLIERGELEDAERLLAGLADRERMHIQDYFGLLGTMAKLHAAKGDMDAAQPFLDSLQGIIETEDDRYRFEQIQRSVRRHANGGLSDLQTLFSKLKQRTMKGGRSSG